jgi:ribosomal protein S18 acetylase RimI-like enzyme
MQNEITIRSISMDDCKVISEAFKAQGWNKPQEQYERYFKEQTEGTREVFIAEYRNEFAGYVTVVWESDYGYFRENRIPEIVDLNTLIKFRKKGIASALLDAAEEKMRERSNIAGIGFGLMPDYGQAQRLYVKRGYIPDGLGVSRGGNYIKYGDNIVVDDDLALYLTRSLNL